MKFEVVTKYALSESDVAALENAGMGKKKFWSFKNLTDNIWVKYGEQWQISTSPFHAILDLEEGKEYQISAGHWDVVNNGRHANQRRCCYVHQGRLYYCNYRELPSQGGFPGSNEEESSDAVSVSSSSTTGVSTSPGTVTYVPILQKRCDFDSSIKVMDEESCPLCDPIDPSKGDGCKNCTMSQTLYIKKVSS